jgi:elongation factor Ts
LDSKGDAAKLEALGRQLAMHIAAANPAAVSLEDLDKAKVERERQVYLEQAQQSGKSADIVAKMVEGRLKKEYFKQVVLLMQDFVIDPEKTVEAAVKAAEKDIGAPVKISGFVRFALGEGIEKAQSDFAAEVAAMAKR